MSRLIFISGDFCSGSTLLFSLFREAGFYCLYEPLHEKLREYIIWPPGTYRRHFYVDNYFREYKGFDYIGRLFDPRWATKDLCLESGNSADPLYRYLVYLVGSAFGRADSVVLKFNRVGFRLGWLRTQFPQGRVVHIYRDRDDQWESMVRRVQEDQGNEDVKQTSVEFNGFHLADFCEDLKGRFPELAASSVRSGYERFCRLWKLSKEWQLEQADVSISLSELTQEFEVGWGRICWALGQEIDPRPLRALIVRSAGEEPRSGKFERLGGALYKAASVVGRPYARARVKLSRRYRS